MVTVIALRHAHSVGNQLDFRQGHLAFPLSKKGLKQCEELENILSPYDISKLYHSDLRRAVETVEYSGILQSVEAEATDSIREMDFGDLSGTITEYNDEELPYSLESHPNFDEGWPNGERYISMYNRIREFCHLLAMDHSPDETVGVVLHQGTLMMLRDFANNVAPLEKTYESTPQLGWV